MNETVIYHRFEINFYHPIVDTRMIRFLRLSLWLKYKICLDHIGTRFVLMILDLSIFVSRADFNR